MIIHNYYDRGIHSQEKLDGNDPQIERSTRRFLFVYGTLKKGGSNNLILKDAKFEGEAQTLAPRAMMDGGIPFLVKSKTYYDRNLDLNYAAHVTGHIFDISKYNLADCDSLEGHPNWYRREIDYFTLGCQMVSAYVYYLNPDRLKWHNYLPLISAPVVSEWRSKRYA